MVAPEGPRPRGARWSAACRRVRTLVAFAALIVAAALALSSGTSQTVEGADVRAGGRWVATWAASPMSPTPITPNPASRGFRDQTVRDVVGTSVGGPRIRLRLSDVYGTRPLRVGAVAVGEGTFGPGVAPGVARRVLFHGAATVTVPAGGQVVSDPVPLAVAAGERLAVSIYLPVASGPVTFHRYARQVNYVAAGNHVLTTGGAAFTTRAASWFVLDGVDARAATGGVHTVVAFGDSITDGVTSTVGGDERWPDDLADRLFVALGDRAPAVVNEGVGGNRLLTGSACYGASGLARFPRDALGQPGVRDVVLLEGVNDIGFSEGPDGGCDRPNTAVTAAQIIAGYRQLVATARRRGVRVYGGTLTPFGGSGLWTPRAQATWTAVNHWIRTSGAFAGVVDFARVVADPGHPDYLNPAYASRDHLHPNDAGYAAMADAIPIAWLR